MECIELDPACLKWTPYVYQTIINDSDIPCIPNKSNKSKFSN